MAAFVFTFPQEMAPHLSLILRLSSIEVNGAELQYHSQPMDGCGAIFGRKQLCVSNTPFTLQQNSQVFI